jgi:dTDP-4-dehydrorhamnose reductase
MMQTVSVIGVSGFVGSRLFATLNKVLPGRGDYATTGTHFSQAAAIGDTEHLDLTKPDCLRDYVLRRRPDTLILVAGSKDLSRCERDPDFAYQLNTVPVDVLCDCIAKNKLTTRLLYISSDYVFDGVKGNYKASDPPSPTTNYGRSKALAERRLLFGDVDGAVVRTAAVMGRHGGFLGWLLHERQNRDSLALLDNSHFSPTPIELLADCVIEIIAGRVETTDRIFHACGSTRMSRYDFGVLANEVLSELGVTGSSCRLEREVLPESRDLSLLPNVFPHGSDNGEEVLKAYLRSELEPCIA